MTDHAAAPTPSEEAPGTPTIRAAVPAMVAGRALDAEVDRVVFGHRVRMLASGGAQWWGETEAFTGWHNVPPYSTDIAAAWLVVEKLTAEGYWMSLEGWDKNTLLEASWTASFWCDRGACSVHGGPSDSGHGSGDVSADTAPLAICRAALAAPNALAAPAHGGTEAV
jgi:hypothetical protein